MAKRKTEPASEPRTVIVRGLRNEDHVATVVDGEGDRLTVQIGKLKPITLDRSDEPKPFTWRLPDVAA